MADDKKAVDLGLLEEDDEFEEFPTAGNYFLLHLYLNLQSTNVNDCKIIKLNYFCTCDLITFALFEIHL